MNYSVARTLAFKNSNIVHRKQKIKPKVSHLKMRQIIAENLSYYVVIRLEIHTKNKSLTRKDTKNHI